MAAIRHLLGALVVGLSLACLAARADTKPKGDAKVLTDDMAVHQAQLKRAFEAFRQKLAVLAGRLETSVEQKDRDRAKALRRVLKTAGERGVEVKFDALIRGLTSRESSKDLDVLGQVLRDNKELRKDLQHLLALIAGDDRAKVLAKRREAAARLLDRLKELRDKQARLQALTELERKESKDLKTEQEKVTKSTKDLLDNLDKVAEDEKLAEAVRPPVGEANREQKDSESKLGKNDRPGAAGAQGRAVSKLDEAIRRVKETLEQIRKEETERILADLLARCKRMLAIEKEVRDGTQTIHRELQAQEDHKPTLAQAARSNKLADRQLENLREAAAALKIVQTEGSAAAFAEVFEQVGKDMDAAHDRLSRAEIDKLTLAIEQDVIDTLMDAIKALEKAIRENDENTPRRGGGDPSGKPKLVSILQQLKMIHALQRRINARTALYGKRFKGEQAPSPAVAENPAEKQRLERTQKELTDLAGRQDRIARVTREVGKEAAGPQQ